MATWTAGEVAEASGAVVLVAADVAISRFVVDSREAGPGALFVAMAGERRDGNDFARDAIEAGSAAVCLTAAPADATLAAARACGCALLRADGDDGEAFLLRLAATWRAAHPQWHVVGVTGSVGKTTTKDMLAVGAATTRRVHATAGNRNSLVGLPLTLLEVPADAEMVILEMGMNAAGEIARLSRCARPELAIITNVGTSHIGMLGSRDAIALAKAEIVCGMEGRSGGVATLMMDAGDDYARRIAREHARPAGVNVTLVGDTTDGVYAAGMTLDGSGCASFDLHFPDGLVLPVHLGIPGGHTVSNFLLAMAAIDRLGLDRTAAVSAIERMSATPMRLELRDAPGGVRVIDDSYNASPASMAAALDVLASTTCSGRRVAVLGEMGELGDDAARLHGYVGAYAAALGLDLLVLIGGDNAAHIGEAAHVMGLPSGRIVRYPTVEAASAALAPTLASGDVVLAKGSRAAGLDAFVRELVHAG